MATEIELKYELLTPNDASNDLVEEITALLNSHNMDFEMKQNQLSNDYYDSGDLALRKMDFGLRIRSKGEHFEQTIKTAGKVINGLHKRPEYNVELSNNQLNLSLFDKEIWPENTNVRQLEENLHVIFSTNFLRQTWLIHQGDNIIELALDRGDISTTSGQPTLTINELEIELVSGEEQALFNLADQLMTITDIKPSNVSKAARGYALYHDKTDRT